MKKYIEKECKTHGLSRFVLEGRGYYRCTKCRSDKVSKRRRKVKALLVEYKGGKCEKCGYNKCIAAMDFHHKDPKEKEFGLSQKGLTKSLELLKKEADKCLLLCANCHRETHESLSEFVDIILIKEKKIPKQSNQCKTCNIETLNKYYCSSECAKIANRKVRDRPTKKRLIELLKNNSWIKIGNLFGVSDNAVRKWARAYKII